jgi:hypothetical protein
MIVSSPFVGLSSKEGLLFWKKEAKNFFELGPCWFQGHGLKVKEVFAPLFSKSGSFLASELI